jgi:hypothetical protein
LDGGLDELFLQGVQQWVGQQAMTMRSQHQPFMLPLEEFLSWPLPILLAPPYPIKTSPGTCKATMPTVIDPFPDHPL